MFASRFLCALVGLCFSFAVFAQAHVTAPGGRSVSEWWYEPTRPGWGLLLTHSGANTVVLYAGFDAQGNDLWQVGVSARNAEHLQADLLQSQWDVSRDRVATQWVAGAIDFRYRDADQADLLLTQQGQTRSAHMRRVISTRQSAVDDYSGLWHNPNLPGFGLALLTQGPVLAALATAYDTSGEPRWWLGYKLSRPNDPAPFVAKRFRLACAEAGCQVQEAVAGSISVQPRNERELSARLMLRTGFSTTPNTLMFANQAVFANLAEPASGRSDLSDARPFHSEAALSDYLELARQGTGVNLPFCLDFSASPPGSVATPFGSGTNTQERSIDEGDIIARSGDLVVHRVPVIRPTDPPRYLSDFRLARIKPNRAEVRALSTLPIPALHAADAVIALPASPGSHRFALLSSNHQGDLSYCGPIAASDTPETLVTVVRVNADDSMTVEWRYSVQASAGILRLSGDALLLLTNASLLVSEPANGNGPQAFRPTWQILGQAAKPLLRADNTWLGGFQPGTLGASVVTVHRLPLQQPEQVRQFSLLTQWANLYVAPDAIYLASPRADPAVFGADNQITEYRSVTNIHKLDAQTLAWRGSIDVRGTLANSWSGTYALQERQGMLRVVTTLSGRSAEEANSAALLTVLTENTAQKKLQVMAELPNAARPESLGRVGEMIYGVRFNDDRLNVVTFRRIDPLYEVDLSVAQDPKIVGQLDISGYADYLHPLPNRRLLGFGVEVDPSGVNFFAPESLKLTLFHLGSTATPMQAQQSFLFGGRYSDLPVRFDPHALSTLQTNTEDLWLTAPARLWGNQLPDRFDPISVLRIRYSLTTDRVLEARTLPMAPDSEEALWAGDARTVLYGEQLYLFAGGRVHGDRLDSSALSLPRIDLP